MYSFCSEADSNPRLINVNLYVSKPSPSQFILLFIIRQQPNYRLKMEVRNKTVL